LSQQEIEALALKKSESCEQPPDHPYTEEELKRSVQNAFNYRMEDPPVKIYRCPELMEKELPDPKWIIPEILPEGVTLLAGAPKIGKSWFVMEMTLSVSFGLTYSDTDMWVAYGKHFCEQGEALHLALEDNERSCKNRLSKILGEIRPPRDAQFSFEWSRGDAAVEKVEEWLDAHPKCRLVVIDCLQQVRPDQKGNQSSYDFDYRALKVWREVAARYSVAIVIVHHSNKRHEDDPLMKPSGTTGLTGAADNVMVMKRQRGTSYAIIHVTGRNVMEQELVVEFDDFTGRWSLKDNKMFLLSLERQAIISELMEAYPLELGISDLAELLKKDRGSIRKLLNKMKKDGQVENVKRGQFRAVPEKMGIQPERED
jgi:hypothetical protein